MPNSCNCLKTTTALQGGTENWLQDPFLQIRRRRQHPFHPRPTLVEICNKKKVKPENPLQPLPAATVLQPGWGQSHIFQTCPGEPVVRFFQERSDFFRTSIMERLVVI